MSIGLVLFLVAPNTAYRCAANRRLDMHFSDGSAQVWRSTLAWQSRLAANRPSHGTSVNMMIRQMERSCALYRALTDHGIGQDEAGALVEAVVMDAYRPVPAAWFKLSRLRSTNPETRFKWVMGLLTRYFFSAPFVHRHLLPQAGEAVAFDVTACPFADYFEDQGVPELTPHAACNTDHCLAQAFGVELVRTQTITQGAEFCDFRWKLRSERN